MQTSTDNGNHVIIIISEETIHLYPQCNERTRNKMKLLYDYTIPSGILATMMLDEIEEAKIFLGYNENRKRSTPYIDGIIVSYNFCNEFLNYLKENGMEYNSNIYKFFELAAIEERKSATN